MIKAKKLFKKWVKSALLGGKYLKNTTPLLGTLNLMSIYDDQVGGPIERSTVHLLLFRAVFLISQGLTSPALLM